MNQHDKVRHYEEARERFLAAARELVEANKRRVAAGQRDSAEMHVAAERLNEALEKLKAAEAGLDRKFEPVALTALVKRKVYDTFAPQDRRTAIELLIKEYGRNLPFKNEAKPKHLEQIRLAAVKLANGNLDELRRYAPIAKIDWRDVIGPAETPEFMRTTVTEFYQLDKQSQAAINQRDRQQYLDWLNSTSSKTRFKLLLDQLFDRSK